MKTNTTFDRFNVRTLPTGHRSLVAMRTQDEVQKVISDGGLTTEENTGLAGVVVACGAIIEHGKTCAQLERNYHAGKTAPPADAADALPIDLQANRHVGGLSDAFKPFVKRFSPSEPEHKAAAAFQRNAFPEGVKYITQATYPQQLERMKDLVQYCRSHEGAAQVHTLNLGLWVQKIQDILPAYEEAIKKLPPAAVSYGQLRAAWKHGHILLCALVQSIFTAFPAQTLQHEQHRARLLAHLSTQEQVVLDSQRRASLKDIDPVTGQEVSTIEVGD